MLKRPLLSAAILLAMATPLAAASVIEVPLSEGFDLTITIESTPELGEFTASRAAFRNGNWEAGTRRGYEFQMKPVADGAWEVNVTGLRSSPFVINEFKVDVRFPINGVAAIWEYQTPPVNTIFRRVPEVEFQVDTRPNLAIPLLIAVDQWGNNSFTAGFVEQGKTCVISAGRDSQHYRMTFIRKAGDHDIPQRAYTSTLYFDQGKDYWFKTLRTYTSVVDKLRDYKPLPIPAGALEPLYSTRYPFSDAINQDIVLANAEIAHKLGIKQFVIDIGWSTNKGWAETSGDYGDYEPASEKFTDLKGTIAKLKKDYGMRVMLWAAPTWIGREAKAFEKMQDYRVKWPNGDYDRNLCPRTPQVREHLAERFAYMAKELGADGFWMDFLDTFYDLCDAPHEHDILGYDDGMSALLGDIYKAVHSVNKDCTIEYRIPYSNLFVKPYANVIETTYTFEDYKANYLMGINIRGINEGVLTKSDPVYWGEAPEHEDVGRHLMTSIFIGPPAISGDLTKMTEERLNQIRGWLDYYQKYREDLLAGEFRPFGGSFHYPDLMIETDKRAFCYLATKNSRVITVSKGASELHIMNANRPQHGQLRLRVEGLPDGNYKGTFYNCFMEPPHRFEDFVSTNGVMPVSTDMETGGMLIFERQ